MDQKSKVGPVMLSVMVHYYPTHITQSSTHSSEMPLILFPILSQLLVSVCVYVCVCAGACMRAYVCIHEVVVSNLN